jgi:hypothetical protein
VLRFYWWEGGVNHRYYKRDDKREHAEKLFPPQLETKTGLQPVAPTTLKI